MQKISIGMGKYAGLLGNLVDKGCGLFHMSLFFLDIDGTIAMPGMSPSSATIQVIQAARSKGHKVFLSTGRPESGVPQAVRTLELDGGIYSAGAKIIVDGAEIFHTAMAPDLVAHTIQIMRSIGVSFNLECEASDYRFTSDSYLRILEGVPTTEMNSELKRLLIQAQTAPRSVRIEDYAGEPVFKVSFSATSQKQVQQIEKSISSQMKMVTFENLTPDFPITVGEVSDRSVNKGIAMQRVCAYLGTTAEQCIAFGDSMNDAEILQAAGIGIAMGNSTEDVKLLADRICGNCEDDGLAEAFYALI